MAEKTALATGPISSPLSGWMEAWSGGRRRAGVCWLVFGKRIEGVRGMIY